jgi:predicted ribosomally synthesized peptide with nif11-like leader
VILEVITSRTLNAMSEEQLKAFWEAVQADAGLQEKLSAAKDADAVVAIANAAGFVISAEDLKRAQAEFSDEELSGVSGAFCGLGWPDGYWELFLKEGFCDLIVCACRTCDFDGHGRPRDV